MKKFSMRTAGQRVCRGCRGWPVRSPVKPRMTVRWSLGAGDDGEMVGEIPGQAGDDGEMASVWMW